MTDLTLNSLAGDGLVGDSQSIFSGDSWTTMRGKSTGTVKNDSLATNWLCYAGEEAFGNRYLYRGVLSFQTADVPGGASVSAAVIRVKPTAVYSGGDVCIVGVTPASVTALALADYGAFGSTQLATKIAVSAFSAGTFKDIPLNASGLAALNLAGNTSFGFRHSYDLLADGPGTGGGPGNSTDQGLTVNYSEQTGSSDDPQLVVTYTVPGSSAGRPRPQRLIVPGRFVR